MPESKTTATDRLRREGRWKEASAYREEQRQRLRAEGKSREEAKETAWRLMNEKFTPTEVMPGITLPVDAMPLLCQVRLLRFQNEGGALDVVDDARWVYERFGDPFTEPLDAPSPGAWSLLVFARRNPASFFEKILPKLLVAKAG